jgi:hypothetical protein
MSSSNLNSKLQSQEIYLDSNYASINNTKNDYNSDMYFFLKTPIVCSSDHDIVLRVESFTCPISFFLINPFNNKLDFSINNVDYSVSFTLGNYNALSLNSLLNSLLSPYNFTITYDSNKNKFTFTHSTQNFIFKSSSTIFKLLGFNDNVNYSSTLRILTSVFVINLSGTSLIYIDIPNITTKNISSKNDGGYTTIVKSIIQNVEYGSILNYVNNTSSAIVLKERYISFFQIRLLDDDYNLLDLQGQNFVLTLEIFYYYNGNENIQSFNINDIIKKQNDEKKSIIEKVNNN